MWNRMQSVALTVVWVALLSGCNRTPTATIAPSIDSSKYVLADEPTGAKDVKDIRSQVKDGEPLVIVGRIGGQVKPWIEGRAGFWIVDSSFKPCNEREDDNCKTPWDYCCDPREELTKGMATIKVVDEQGQTLSADARTLFGLKELDTVVVKGHAKRDDKGNLTVLASGIFRRVPAKKVGG